MTTHELHVAYKTGLAFEQGIQQGIEQGIEQGEQLGEEKHLEKVVVMLTLKGFSVSQINELLEVPLEKIETILQQHRNADAASDN